MTDDEAELSEREVRLSILIEGREKLTSAKSLRAIVRGMMGILAP